MDDKAEIIGYTEHDTIKQLGRTEQSYFLIGYRHATGLSQEQFANLVEWPVEEYIQIEKGARTSRNIYQLFLNVREKAGQYIREKRCRKWAGNAS